MRSDRYSLVAKRGADAIGRSPREPACWRELVAIRAGALCQLSVQGHLLTIAHDGQSDLVVHLALVQELSQALLLANRLAVDLRNHVALLEAGLARRAVRPHLGD